MFDKIKQRMSKDWRFLKKHINCLALVGVMAFIVSPCLIFIPGLMTFRLFFGGERTEEAQKLLNEVMQKTPQLEIMLDPWFWCSLFLIGILLAVFGGWSHPEAQRDRKVIRDLNLPWPPKEFQ